VSDKGRRGRWGRSSKEPEHLGMGIRAFSQHRLSLGKLEGAPRSCLFTLAAATSKGQAGLLPCVCDLLSYFVEQKSVR